MLQRSQVARCSTCRIGAHANCHERLDLRRWLVGQVMRRHSRAMAVCHEHHVENVALSQEIQCRINAGHSLRNDLLPLTRGSPFPSYRHLDRKRVPPVFGQANAQGLDHIDPVGVCPQPVHDDCGASCRGVFGSRVDAEELMIAIGQVQRFTIENGFFDLFGDAFLARQIGTGDQWWYQ